MIAVASPVATGSYETIRARLARTHGVSILSSEPVAGGVEICLTAHSVQAAEFAECELGGLEPGQAWTEAGGLLTLSVVLRADV
jgi:hypothetical protein